MITPIRSRRIEVVAGVVAFGARHVEMADGQRMAPEVVGARDRGESPADGLGTPDLLVPISGRCPFSLNV